MYYKFSYQIFIFKLPFENASEWCAAKGMQLAIIESPKELMLILAHFGPGSSK
jgi:hypothetical protein